MNLVDDASSTTLARVGAQETIWAAAGVLRAWIERYGVPQALYTDWKNVYVCEPTEKEQIRGIIGLPGYQITGIEEEAGKVRISARHAGPISCPDCGGGRSEAALESYLRQLPGRDWVRVVSMDLASVYRALVRKYFPRARIVADRFHVIRLINHHFLACWREIDPAGSKNRGLRSLMRRHRHNLKPEQKLRLLAYLAQNPALEVIYRFKQRLCYLLLKKHKTRRQCQKLIPRFLRAVVELRQSGLAQLVVLGDTLHSWSEEIARMWRFTRSNGITEGFHNKMETLSRQAYGFRNFENYRLRVKVLCS